jgi:hypothetical protein
MNNPGLRLGALNAKGHSRNLWPKFFARAPVARHFVCPLPLHSACQFLPLKTKGLRVRRIRLRAGISESGKVLRCNYAMAECRVAAGRSSVLLVTRSLLRGLYPLQQALCAFTGDVHHPVIVGDCAQNGCYHLQLQQVACLGRLFSLLQLRFQPQFVEAV